MGIENRETSFPIVGIGGSAGGLNALHCFVGELPKEFGFAVVFMQHLSTKHKSLLADLLHSRRPDIETREIDDGLDVLPGKIYLCPPGKDVSIQKGAFFVSPASERLHFPIDKFFVSLAEEAGERAIAVILSGAGTDGARGVAAIRNAGGTVFVQEPATAEFPGMPIAATATGQADAVLPPEDITREIIKIQGAGPAGIGEDFNTAHFETFLRLIREKTGCNFGHYKKNVLGRRIRRRMYLRGVSSVQGYIKMLAEKNPEAADLASDLMIGVTSFFRDRLAWKALKTDVISKLVASDNDQPLRIWTPACATGEESYSIAMMLRHEFDLAGKRRDMHVFATDINDLALEKAREARYPGSIIADVPSDYMKKFFTCSQDGMSVIINKEIRESVVFARQDLLFDPPFSRLDLIICRNLMIYFEPEAQEKCIALFHYALKDSGYLFLGNVETPGSKGLLFKSLGHKRCRIYQKIETAATVRPSLAVTFATDPSVAAPSRAMAGFKQSITDFVQQKLLDESGPAAIAVNQHYDIVYSNGPTNRYLLQPRGAPTQNLLELLPENLRGRIREALNRAAREAGPISVRALMTCAGVKKRRVTFRISKLRDNLFLVIFHEKGSAPEETAALASVDDVDDNTVHQFKSELLATRAELQNRMGQLEGLNEELQSSNEELQAANEELETSREELQSLNEELITVNNQLQSKIEEEEGINNDLNNFLSSTDIPTFFLDSQFRVKRFTPAMSRLLRLLPSDVGRPIIDMSQKNLGPDLIADAREVLDRLVPVRREISINDDRYIRVTLPYRTSDNHIEGVVITYNDVSDLKRAEERTRHLASFPQLNPNPVLEINAAGAIVFSNASAEKILKDCGMDKTDVTVFLPHDIDNILNALGSGENTSFIREIEIKDRAFAEMVHLAPQFGVVRIYAFEITARKRAESVAQARFRILESAYRADLFLDDALRMVLDEIEAQTRSTIGFYHFLEADQETLSLQNWSTNTLEKMCTAEGKGSHYPVSQAGVWVDCVRERRPVIHNDYASMPNRKGMPPGHAPVIREMIVPVMRSNSVVAIIGVGNKPTDYNEMDVEIASLLGDFSWEIVERKRAEEALRATSERHRSYIDLTGQLGWTTNANGEVIEDMPSWRAYTGQTYDEVKGWGWATALHPDDAAHTEQVWRQAVSGKSSYEVEYRIRRHDGIYRHFMARGIPVFREDGSVLEWVGTCIDITERKRAEQEMIRLNNVLKALSDSSQAVVRSQNEKEYLKDVCRIVTEDCGYSMVWIGYAENDDAKSVRPVAYSGFEEGYLETLKITWADTERGRGPTGTAIRTGKMAMCRNMLTDPSFAPWRQEALTRGYASSIVFPLFIEGRVLGAMTIYSKETDPFSVGEIKFLTELADNMAYGITVLRTRTARANAEEALKKSLRRFELLTLTAGELLQSTEPQRVVESVCGKVMEYLDCHSFFNFLADEQKGKLLLNAYAGISQEEAKKIEWLDFGVAVCGCAARDAVRIVAEHIPTTPDERTELVKSFGIKAYCCHPLFGPGGKVIGTLSFGTRSRETFSEKDISLMKAVSDQVAAAMIRMRNEADVLKLGQDMAARNVELENVNKELEAFIYSISHDLRAPIRTVAGFARFLDHDYRDKLDDQALDYIKRICAASGRVTLLIDDLLRLAKISRQEVDRAKIDLTKLAASVVADLRETDPKRSVEVVIAEGITVFADLRLMQIVLTNLLGNAWKFTSKTESARIEFGAAKKDGKTVYYVRDNGAGFNPQYMEKIFWPFQRLHSESEFEGTGIGLTIVERIAHRHGGRVWAEGEVGKGATIYFTMG